MHGAKAYATAARANSASDQSTTGKRTAVETTTPKVTAATEATATTAAVASRPSGVS